MASITLTAIGFLVIERRLLLLKAFGGVYLVIVATVVSASINDPAEVVGSLTKWGYFIVLTAAAFEALGRHGSGAVFRTLIVAFLPPLALQALSVVVGLGKFSTSDNSICYIGGYNHEAAFSIIVLTFLYCSCFLEPDRPILTFDVHPHCPRGDFFWPIIEPLFSPRSRSSLRLRSLARFAAFPHPTAHSSSSCSVLQEPCSSMSRPLPCKSASTICSSLWPTSPIS